MKITEIECLIAGSPTLNNVVYVRTHTDSGIYGIGEAYRVGPDLATPHWVAYFAEQLVGRSYGGMIGPVGWAIAGVVVIALVGPDLGWKRRVEALGDDDPSLIWAGSDEAAPSPSKA